MNIENKLKELAISETSIIERVSKSYPSVADKDKILEEVFYEYYDIYEEYASLSKNSLEALKRAIFIQWYSLSEPSHNTGIPNLEIETEEMVLKNAQKFISKGLIDDEFIWMINYYYMWDYVFTRIPGFDGFDSRIVNEENNKLPKMIDLEQMKTRGQMGEYWYSIFCIRQSNQQ